MLFWKHTQDGDGAQQRHVQACNALLLPQGHLHCAASGDDPCIKNAKQDEDNWLSAVARQTTCLYLLEPELGQAEGP